LFLEREGAGNGTGDGNNSQSTTIARK